MNVSVVGRHTGHQGDHSTALMEGLSHLGIPTRRYFSAQGVNGLAACWGWRMGQILHRTGDVLVMERGYLGDRFKWTSLGWNGLNGYASFPAIPDDGGERFKQHFGDLMKPWRYDGEYVLLIGQVPGDASLKGKDMRPWYAQAARLAQLHYEILVMFRPHPLAARRGRPIYPVPGTRVQQGPLSDALAKAAVVITWNSNTAVESVLAGVPTVCMDRGSMAYEVCSHDIQAPLVRPDRDPWAHRLAHRQFTIEEIRSGEALRGLFAQKQSEAA